MSDERKPTVRDRDETGHGAERPERVARTVDVAGVEEATRLLLRALGQSPDAPGTQETPKRVAKAWAEMLQPEPFTPTTFENEGDYDELVLVRDIPFWSFCEHHLLPFHGVAHVAYLPGERIVGLSKLARVVEFFARDLQVQERLTQQVAGWLNENLQPRAVGVVLEAEHLCMSLRGVKKPGSRTVTSSLTGTLRSDARTREEFLALVRR